MHTQSTKAKKNNTYIYTEADLGEGLLHAGVSQLYWISKEINKKLKSLASSTGMVQKNSCHNDFCY